MTVDPKTVPPVSLSEESRQPAEDKSKPDKSRNRRGVLSRNHGAFDGLGGVSGLADHFDSGFALQHAFQSFSKQRVVINDKTTDGHGR